MNGWESTSGESGSFALAAVPTLGEPVQVKVPAGTRSGRTFRVRGKGAPMAGGAGDLLVTVDVIVPTTMTAEQKTAVEALASATTGQNPRSHLGV